MSRPRRAVNNRRDYAKMDRFGISDSEDDVLDLTDPDSHDFDDGETVAGNQSATEEIHKLINQSIQKDQRRLYELQGARPKSQSQKKQGSQNKEPKPKPVKKKEKGESNLNDLRQNKSLSKFVESQLCELLQGKLSGSKVELYDTEIDSHSESSATSSDEFTPNASSSPKARLSRKSNRKVKTSGMVKKACDDVVNPQIWPHSMLQYEYVNRNTKFQDLDFRLFVAGELEIITSSKIKQSEKSARIAFLKKIVYYSGIYQWKALLDFYAAFLRQIETGQKTWKDDSVYLEVPLLSKYIKTESKKVSIVRKDVQKPPIIWYCAQFQKNKCTKQSPHSILLRGVNREVHHICATCYRIDKIQSSHPESSTACPHFSD